MKQHPSNTYLFCHSLPLPPQNIKKEIENYEVTGLGPVTYQRQE